MKDIVILHNELNNLEVLDQDPITTQTQFERVIFCHMQVYNILIEYEKIYIHYKVQSHNLVYSLFLSMLTVYGLQDRLLLYYSTIIL